MYAASRAPTRNSWSPSESPWAGLSIAKVTIPALANSNEAGLWTSLSLLYPCIPRTPGAGLVRVASLGRYNFATILFPNSSEIATSWTSMLPKSV